MSEQQNDYIYTLAPGIVDASKHIANGATFAHQIADTPAPASRDDAIRALLDEVLSEAECGYLAWCNLMDALDAQARWDAYVAKVRSRLAAVLAGAG